MCERHYWVSLNCVPGIGPARFRALIDFFGSAQAAWQAAPESLAQAGLDQRALKNLLDYRSQVDPAALFARTQASSTQILTWEDPDYPPYLLEIPDPPPVLYLRGELQMRDQWALAVVGTRRASQYGRMVTRQLVGDLARSGATIISGLALGIDGAAHQAALDAGGRTLAVLGSGFNHLYPPQHRKLAEKIVENGALLTEFAPDAPPEAGNFPRRNRIISGLALGVLVVEAGLRSGAIITADYALEQGRDIFAVPGPINARSSRGTNLLIQQGAKLVLAADDILEELNLTMVEQQVATQLALPATPEEAQLLQLLSDHPRHVDELSRQAALPVSQVTSALTLMELKGMVRQLEGMNYIRLREGPEEYQPQEGNAS